MDASKSLLEFNKARAWVGGWVDGWVGGWMLACASASVKIGICHCVKVKVSVVSLKRIRYKNSDGWLMSVFG